MGNNNGVNMNSISDNLQDEVTVGYRPTIPLEALWQGGGDIPQLSLRRDVEFMQIHPIVMTAMEYYKAGISGAEFWGGPDFSNPQNDMGKPISMNPKVAQYVMAHCERFWQRGVPLIQDSGYPHGWAPGEYVYKEVEGMLVWSHVKVFHPRDGFILTHEYQPVGVRVKNIKGRQPVELHFASENIPAKGCWYAHRPRYNNLYGRSQLTGAWRPWRRLGWRDALEQIIDAALYRAGYCGPIVRHPSEDSQSAQEGINSTRLDGQGNPRRSARDVARQMIEWAKAGAGFTMSSAQYPPGQGGGPKWELIWPEHVMDVRPLIEAARYLEDQIMLGIGVPPELVKPGGTGSGYSGRSIPREAFLDGQQKVADAMLQMFVEQVLKPLVLWNFGDVPFNVQCKSLLKSQSDDKMGEEGGKGEEGAPDDLKKSQAAKDAWAKRQPQSNNQAPKPGPAMSVDDNDNKELVLSIVDKVLRRAA